MLEESPKPCDTNKEKITDKIRNKCIPWDQYFMAQAVSLSLRSMCARLEVGATLVRKKRVTAGGYNGAVSGDVRCIDEGCYIVDGRCLQTIHAKTSALLQYAKLGISTEGSEIYATHFPCLACTKALLQAGVKGINYPHDYRNDPYTQALIERLGISVHQVALDSQHFPKLQNELTGKHIQRFRKVCPKSVGFSGNYVDDYLFVV